MRISLLFLVLLMFSFQILSADETAGSENFGLTVETKPPKPEIPPCSTKLDCTSQKNAFKGREYTKLGNYKKAEKYYKKHLKKHKDPAVLAELAKLYEIQKKYYLAGLAFKEAGMIEEYNRIEQLRLKSFKEKGSPEVWESAKKQSELFKKAYKRKKLAAISLIFLGSSAFIAGISTSYLALPAPFLFGEGIKLFGIGIFLNTSANYSLNISSAFKKISLNYYDEGTDAIEYYEKSGEKNAVKKLTSKSLKNHGLFLSIFSLPQIIAGVSLLIAETVKDSCQNSPEGALCFSDKLFAGYSLIGTGGVSLIGGTILLIKSYIWSRKTTEESLFTLNSIAPMIDPVSKTYGLSMVFSF